MKRLTTIAAVLFLAAFAMAEPPVPGAQLPAHLPRNGLVAFWSFDGHARDSLGTHHATVGRGVSFVPDRHGKESGAIAFNGSIGTVKVPDHNALDTDEAFTLSAWINPKAYKDDRRNYPWIVSKFAGSGVRADYLLCLSVTGQVGLSVIENARARKVDSVKAPGVIPKNVWTHVAASFDRGRLKSLGTVVHRVESSTSPRKQPDLSTGPAD